MTQKVLFKHCDPAGIVFYPRYFEMINDTVESFFDVALNYPFEHLLTDNGVPLVQIAVKFNSPSRHGDVLNMELRSHKLGTSSLDMSLDAVCNEQTRFNATFTLVFVDSTAIPTPWPDSIRQIIEAQISGEAQCPTK